MSLTLIVSSNIALNFFLQFLLIARVESLTHLDLYYSLQSLFIISSGYLGSILQSVCYRHSINSAKRGKYSSIYITLSFQLSLIYLFILPFLIFVNYMLFGKIADLGLFDFIFVSIALAIGNYFQGLLFVLYFQLRAFDRVIKYELIILVSNLFFLLFCLRANFLGLHELSLAIMIKNICSLLMLSRFRGIDKNGLFKFNRQIFNRVIVYVGSSLTFKLTPLIDKVILVNLFSGAVVLFTLAASVVGSIVQLIDKAFMTKYINEAQKKSISKFNHYEPIGILACMSLLFVMTLLFVKYYSLDAINTSLIIDYFNNLRLSVVILVLIILSPLIFINSHNMLVVSMLYKVEATRLIFVSGGIGFLFGSLLKYQFSNIWGVYGFGLGCLSYYLIIYVINMLHLRRLKQHKE